MARWRTPSRVGINADLGGRTSSEIVADLVPGARLVKAANTLGAKVLGADPHEAGGRRVIFLAGRDAPARAAVVALFDAAGFFAIVTNGSTHGETIGSTYGMMKQVFGNDTRRRRETMAMVRSITITTTITEAGKEAGAVTGHTVEARVEVGGEERVYDVSSVNPTITSLVEQLVNAVHQETLHESRPEMQRVLDAEQAFER